jgi:hypothetical protein
VPIPTGPYVGHALAASAPREGTMAHALARARHAAISRSEMQSFFTNAIVCPVLTAVASENSICRRDGGERIRT